MDCCLWRVWRVLQVFSGDGSPCSVLPSASLFPGLHIQALLETTGGGFLLCFHLDRHQVSWFHWNEEDHLAGPSGLSMTRAETPVGPGLNTHVAPSKHAMLLRGGVLFHPEIKLRNFLEKDSSFWKQLCFCGARISRPWASIRGDLRVALA